jgi:hypothetical protein
MGAWSPWDNTSYCSLVIRKNVKSHRHANLSLGTKYRWARAMRLSLHLVSMGFLWSSVMTAARNTPMDPTKS